MGLRRRLLSDVQEIHPGRLEEQNKMIEANHERMVLVWKHVDDEGDEVTHELPGRYAVCGRCQGKGSHVNPSIDRRGLSREDFDEDPDFAESYLAGDYDIQCQTCGGRRVVLVVDESRCERSLLTEFINYEDEEAASRAADRRTMWMEDGCNPDSGPEDY